MQHYAEEAYAVLQGTYPEALTGQEKEEYSSRT
jgi:hypothetical protein